MNDIEHWTREEKRARGLAASTSDEALRHKLLLIADEMKGIVEAARARKEDSSGCEPLPPQPPVRP